MEQVLLFTKKSYNSLSQWKSEPINEPIGEPSGGVNSSGKLISTSPDKKLSSSQDKVKPTKGESNGS